MMHYSIPFADWMAGRHLIANQTLGILEFMQAQIRKMAKWLAGAQ
jgi:hypothetical protein